MLGVPESVILCPHATPWSFHNAFAEESLYKRYSALEKRALSSLKVVQPKDDPFQVNDPPPTDPKADDSPVTNSDTE